MNQSVGIMFMKQPMGAECSTCILVLDGGMVRRLAFSRLLLQQGASISVSENPRISKYSKDLGVKDIGIGEIDKELLYEALTELQLHTNYDAPDMEQTEALLVRFGDGDESEKYVYPYHGELYSDLLSASGLDAFIKIPTKKLRTGGA